MPFKNTINDLFGRDSRKYEFVRNSLSEPKFYGTAMIFEPHLLSRMISDFDAENVCTARDLKQAMNLDIKDRLPNDLLTRSDRATSCASLELRVPFLAHQIVDYSAGISTKLMMKNSAAKISCKKTCCPAPRPGSYLS